MANTETTICNQGLGFIGAKQISDFDTDTSVQGIQCRLHYAPTRDALLRSYRWRFAAGREDLTQNAGSPDFEYANQFDLPDDFMALRSVFGDNLTPARKTRITYAIEGQLLLTDESVVQMKYTKKITDTSLFDPLFVKVLVAQLADEFIGPLAGGDFKMQEKIERRLKVLLPKARAMDRQEQNTIGSNDRDLWVDSHLVQRTPITERR